MAYLPPYATLKDGIALSPDGELVVMSRDMFRMFVAALAQAAPFDAAWYAAEYPDVADSIGDGELGDELDHFVVSGYEEGRAPARLAVDEFWYRDAYPDVDEAIREGIVASAEDHYNDSGYLEGRASDPASENEVLRWQEVIAQSADLLNTQGGGAAVPWSKTQQDPAVGARV